MKPHIPATTAPTTIVAALALKTASIVSISLSVIFTNYKLAYANRFVKPKFSAEKRGGPLSQPAPLPVLRAYPIMRRAQIAPSDFSSDEADFPQESFVDFKGKRRCMTEKIPASCVRIISG